ncbi:MAG: DoxX family protein [Bacteroidota bacterium]
MKYLSWAVRLVVAAILLQTLFFKFTASAESVFIFEKTGLGAAGRIGTGIFELIAAVLLLVPRTAWFGALMAAGMMCGALFFHLTSLGIEVMGDGGTLFFLALAVFLGSLLVLFLHRAEWLSLISRFRKN